MLIHSVNSNCWLSYHWDLCGEEAALAAWKRDVVHIIGLSRHTGCFSSGSQNYFVSTASSENSLDGSNIYIFSQFPFMKQAYHQISDLTGSNYAYMPNKALRKLLSYKLFLKIFDDKYIFFYFLRII